MFLVQGLIQRRVKVYFVICEPCIWSGVVASASSWKSGAPVCIDFDPSPKVNFMHIFEHMVGPAGFLYSTLRKIRVHVNESISQMSFRPVLVRVPALQGAPLRNALDALHMPVEVSLVVGNPETIQKTVEQVHRALPFSSVLFSTV